MIGPELHYALPPLGIAVNQGDFDFISTVTLLEHQTQTPNVCRQRFYIDDGNFKQILLQREPLFEVYIKLFFVLAHACLRAIEKALDQAGEIYEHERVGS